MCGHTAVPAAGDSGRGRAGRAADLQVDNVAAVRLAVADLHPAGFSRGLLPYTRVLNGQTGEGERPTVNIQSVRKVEGCGSLQRGTGTRRHGD